MSTPSIVSSIQKLRTLLTREEKWKWLGILGFAICTSVLEVITASIIIIFAQVLSQPSMGLKYIKKLGLDTNISSGKIVFYMAAIFGFMYVIKNLVAACEVFYQNFTIQKMNCAFKEKLLRRYALAEYNFYLTKNSSYMANVVEGDANHTFSSGMVSLASILSEGLVFIFLISTIIWVNPSLAIIIFLVGGVLGFCLTKIFLPIFYRWGQGMQEATTLATQNLYQFLHGFKEIILMGKREIFIHAYQNHTIRKAKTQAVQTAANALPRMVLEVLFVLLFVFTTAYLCLDHEQPQQMLGVLGGYLYVGFRLMPGLNRVIGCLNTFKYYIPSMDRVYDEYMTVTTKEKYLDIPELKFEKSLILKKISFGYLNTQKDVLKNVSFTIQKGECLGIIGETGSGKSTLVDLILGLLHPGKGEILVDGKYPVNSYQWHKKIGYVSQTFYLIDDTIEANIVFGQKAEEVDQNRLHKAIEEAQLESFINNLADGVKTLIGERGVRISGGERQRIAIARALYHTPEVLIFDEATSALDNETEKQLIKTIHAVSEDRTVIMIAHRLTTLKNCKHIIMVKNGYIEPVENFSKA